MIVEKNGWSAERVEENGTLTMRVIRGRGSMPDEIATFLDENAFGTAKHAPIDAISIEKRHRKQKEKLEKELDKEKKK